MNAKQLKKALQGRQYRLLRRFCLQQANGKRRCIDDAAEGGQSEHTCDCNKLQFCTALRPAEHMRALVLSPDAEPEPPADEGILTGGEDWPDAYRLTPILPEDAEACVVVFWHHEWDCPAYQIYSGMLFGLPAAVTAFNRFSRICEMLSRRLVAVPLSMYFDDANFQDWKSAKGSAQEAVNSLMDGIGSPFADAKRQKMARTADFLGLEHDMANVLTQGEVKFWPCLLYTSPSPRDKRQSRMPSSA